MIQQVAFEVPAEIAVKLAMGELIQYGGVVRDLSGRIVKHLKPADVADSANAAKQVAVRALAVAKENKKLAVGALVVAGVAAVGGAAYGVVSHIKHRKALEEQKGAMDAFNVALPIIFPPSTRMSLPSRRPMDSKQQWTDSEARRASRSRLRATSLCRSSRQSETIRIALPRRTG